MARGKESHLSTVPEFEVIKQTVLQNNEKQAVPPQSTT